MKSIYSYGRQSINISDIKAVLKVLKSDRLTQGPYIEKFEKALGNKFGAKYVSVVSNGTAALHLTGLALGWKPNDIVITSPITFLASANCIVYSGAIPDFIDIDKDYYTIDVNKLEEKIKHYNKQKKKIKAVIGVDYAGQPCDWKGLRYLADKYEFQLINDNCHALGAKYFGSEKYAVKYADVVCQSYHPVKHITTGEGGAVLTNKKEIDEKIKILRTHGVVKNFTNSQSLTTNHQSLTTNYQQPTTDNQQPLWYYEMQMLGYNYRITDFQCALGISQLKKLNNFVKIRRKIAYFYNRYFNNDGRFIIPKVMKNAEHSYHLYPLQIKYHILKKDKPEVFRQLLNYGIIGQVHYIPVHIQPYYRKNFGFKHGDYPIAEKFYENEISVPIYTLLNNNNLKFIVNKLNIVIK